MWPWTPQVLESSLAKRLGAWDQGDITPMLKGFLIHTSVGAWKHSREVYQGTEDCALSGGWHVFQPLKDPGGRSILLDAGTSYE